MLKKILALAGSCCAPPLAMAAVDVNKATEAQLDSIKGIGPSTSKTILLGAQERRIQELGRLHRARQGRWRRQRRQVFGRRPDRQRPAYKKAADKPAAKRQACQQVTAKPAASASKPAASAKK